jgi:hypothetical protein
VWCFSDRSRVIDRCEQHVRRPRQPCGASRTDHSDNGDGGRRPPPPARPAAHATGDHRVRSWRPHGRCLFTAADDHDCVPSWRSPGAVAEPQWCGCATTDSDRRIPDTRLRRRRVGRSIGQHPPCGRPCTQPTISLRTGTCDQQTGAGTAGCGRWCTDLVITAGRAASCGQAWVPRSMTCSRSPSSPLWDPGGSWPIRQRPPHPRSTPVAIVTIGGGSRSVSPSGPPAHRRPHSAAFSPSVRR